MYGDRIPRYLSRRARSVVGRVGNAPYGNVTLEIGQEDLLNDGAWVKTEHVVLTPAEAFRFAREIQNRAEGGLEMAERHGRNVEAANRIARREERLREEGY